MSFSNSVVVVDHFDLRACQSPNEENSLGCREREGEGSSVYSVSSEGCAGGNEILKHNCFLLTGGALLSDAVLSKSSNSLPPLPAKNTIMRRAGWHITNYGVNDSLHWHIP